MFQAARVRRAGLLLAALLLLVPPTGATWSIILVDTATHEVAIGSATCLNNVDLKRLLPVLLVERGGGCAQSAVDSSGANRKIIWDQLLLGTAPADIIDILVASDGAFQQRQYGIADLSPAAAGYTGTSAKAYKADIHGTDGSLTWAIQGNVLTGAPVLEMARDAVLATHGTLSDRLMAGMEAARSMGGDGRCSCSTSNPSGCGSPPPNFVKSAHVGFVVVARPGDLDGTCEPILGCASGSYWLALNVAFQGPQALDPVLQLEAQYDDFRAALPGHPDGLRSLAYMDAGDVLGDEQSTRQITVAVFDVDGAPVTHGGATLSLTHAPGSAGLSHLGAVADHGDGTYTLEIVAGLGEGTDRLALHIDDGVKPVTLFPYPELVHAPALRASAQTLSVSSGSPVSLDLLGPSGPASPASSRFVIALSAGGTRPGQVLPSGLVVPLNLDHLFQLSPELPALGMLAGTPGVLDVQGHAAAALAPHPDLFAPLVGLDIACAWFTIRPATFASNPVTVQIAP